MAKSQISAAVPYAWPYDGSFSRETTALVIIDMQNDFCTEGGYITHQGYDISGTRAIIPKIQSALHAFRQAGWQVYHTREGDSVPRFKLLHAYSPDPKQYKAIVLTSQRSPLERHSVRETTPRAKESVHRVRWEADCSSAEARDTTPSLSSIFELLLRNRGIRNLLVAGVTTDVCVSTTIREASDRGFDCAILRDACASVDEALHKATLGSIIGEGGIFGTVLAVDNVLEAMGQAAAR